MATVEHEAAIGWVVDSRHKKILLVLHREYGWSCAGGHVEPGESPLDAVRRELREETGLHADPVGDSAFYSAYNDGCTKDPDAVDLVHHFRFEVDSDEAVFGEPDQSVDWFAFDDLPDPRHAEVDVWLKQLGG